MSLAMVPIEASGERGLRGTMTNEGDAASRPRPLPPPPPAPQPGEANPDDGGEGDVLPLKDRVEPETEAPAGRNQRKRGTT